MNVVLVRHAHPIFPTPVGPDEFCRALVERGHAQAQQLVETLSRPRPALIASSPYLRARQTVEPLARALGMAVAEIPELREWDSGLAPTPDWERHYAHSWAHPSWARGDGESLDQLTRRAVAIIDSLTRQHSGATVLISSHGTFICRALLGFGVAGVDWAFSRAMPMPAVYRISLRYSRIHAAGPGLARDEPPSSTSAQESAPQATWRRGMRCHGYWPFMVVALRETGDATGSFGANVGEWSWDTRSWRTRSGSKSCEPPLRSPRIHLGSSTGWPRCIRPRSTQRTGAPPYGSCSSASRIQAPTVRTTDTR
ncbi:histidine phosphatase family protein [Nocardia amamiensis]|uniref:Histidine phosphatase family protein n=1 Tax=Nocardia amamiensis TaxID=404578 RepID=A0ABS0D280_9NOCA|nr:histidine phosphatase family protein [Nocardia amamiensis]